MRGLWVVASALAVVAEPASAAWWYYCDTAKAYYPYVATCAVPWRAVPAQPVVVPPVPVPAPPPVPPSSAVPAPAPPPVSSAPPPSPPATSAPVPIAPPAAPVQAGAGQPAKARAAPAAPAGPVLGPRDLSRILSAHDQDRTHFERDFKGRRFRAAGSFGGLTDTGLGAAFLEMKLSGNSVFCRLDKAGAARMAGKSKGDPLAAEGVIEDVVLGNLYLDRCAFGS
jgi:hypothetical protein